MALDGPEIFSYRALAQKKHSSNIGSVAKVQELMDKANIILQRNLYPIVTLKQLRIMLLQQNTFKIQGVKIIWAIQHERLGELLGTYLNQFLREQKSKCKDKVFKKWQEFLLSLYEYFLFNRMSVAQLKEDNPLLPKHYTWKAFYKSIKGKSKSLAKKIPRTIPDEIKADWQEIIDNMTPLAETRQDFDSFAEHLSSFADFSPSIALGYRSLNTLVAIITSSVISCLETECKFTLAKKFNESLSVIVNLHLLYTLQKHFSLLKDGKLISSKTYQDEFNQDGYFFSPHLFSILLEQLTNPENIIRYIDTNRSATSYISIAEFRDLIHSVIFEHIPDVSDVIEEVARNLGALTISSDGAEGASYVCSSSSRNKITPLLLKSNLPSLPLLHIMPRTTITHREHDSQNSSREEMRAKSLSDRSHKTFASVGLELAERNRALAFQSRQRYEQIEEGASSFSSSSSSSSKDTQIESIGSVIVFSEQARSIVIPILPIKELTEDRQTLSSARISPGLQGRVGYFEEFSSPRKSK